MENAGVRGERSPLPKQTMSWVSGVLLLRRRGGALAELVGGREVLAHLGLSRDLVLPPGVDVSGDLGFTGLLLTLVVLAGAEAFRRGRKLEDTEGLV